MKLKVVTLLGLSTLCLSLGSQTVAGQDPPKGEIGIGGHEKADQGDPFLRRVRLKAAIEMAEAENNKMKSESLQLFEFAEEIHDSVLAKSLATPDNYKKLTNIEKL